MSCFADVTAKRTSEYVRQPRIFSLCSEAGSNARPEPARGLWRFVPATFKKRFGSSPGTYHRMPTCCQMMHDEMTQADEVLTAPPKINVASLVIRYCLPRIRYHGHLTTRESLMGEAPFDAVAEVH